MKLFLKYIAGCAAAVISAAAVCALHASAVAAETPAVSAKSAILIEASTGDVLWGKRERDRLPMASTTKIMTALLAIESGALGETVTVSSSAIGVEGSSIYLHVGEKLTMRQLVEAVLLESANDAATAIACELAGSVEGFADMMNERAAELGLKDTHFTNPHGLDNPDHYTTAYDLAKLSAYALKNTTFREISSTRIAKIPLCGSEGTRVLVNHNKMLRLYPDAVGVKTGYTKKSGRCLVSAAERNGVLLVAVTLDAPDDWNDHTRMLDYGFSAVRRVALSTPGSLAFVVGVVCPDGDVYVRAVNKDAVYAGAAEGDTALGPVTAVTELKRFYYAPVCKGDVLGRVIYKRGDTVIGETRIVAAEDCPS